MRNLAFAALLVILGAHTALASTRFLFAQPNASSAPGIAVGEKGVEVYGSPGGRVVLYSSALSSLDGVIVERTAARMLEDPNHDGVFNFLATIPFRSVWISVDFLTGEYAVGSRTGFAIRPLRLDLGNLKSDQEGVIGIFDREQLAADMLIVRPGKGAWRIRAFEGGIGDADLQRNGKLSLPAESAKPVDGTNDPPPKRLKQGDVIALIDPMRLEVFVGTVTK